MHKERVIIGLVLLLALGVAVALYYTFAPEPCETYACFQDHMAVCSRATYVNEEPEASWRYTIVRRTSETCEIRVVLLQAKEGDLQLRGFESHTMICTYSRGVVAYPDKDMSLCHGLLKEDLQGIIIEKLHRYLVDNLVDIKDALKTPTERNSTINSTA